MSVVSLPQIVTYISYIFIIIAYAFKVKKVATMPLHLRWELYPVPHEPASAYGGSYFEELEWWKKPLPKNRFKDILYLLKNYLLFWEYLRKDIKYWLTVYPWHTGFYLIVFFHILSFFGALAIVVGNVQVAAGSPNLFGLLLYYLTIIVALTSFITGSIGSIGLLIERTVDRDLRDFAAPINYFNYIFFLVVFLSGFSAWYFGDPTFSGYREFWAGLITFQYATVDSITFVHVMLFSLFLIYLPFTRSTHYITKIIAFFKVRWDDVPSLKGSKMEEEVKKLLEQPVSWSASHIQTGKKWSEVVKGMPEDIGSGKK